MQACPSTFALDDMESRGVAPDDRTARHVDTCARCRERAAGRARLRQRFERDVRAPLWARITAAPPSPAWRSPLWFACAAAAGLAAVLIAIAGPARERYTGAKGQATVEVLGRRQGQVFAFEAGTAARPGDELQFSVRASRSDERYVLIGSVDGTGRFSPFYPSALDGRSVPVPRRGEPLAPPIVLDGGPGPERILVALSAEPLSVRALAPLAERGAAAGESSLAVPGAGPVTVRWFVLPKILGSGAP
jgi:hypothetical protein